MSFNPNGSRGSPPFRPQQQHRDGSVGGTNNSFQNFAVSDLGEHVVFGSSAPRPGSRPESLFALGPSSFIRSGGGGSAGGGGSTLLPPGPANFQPSTTSASNNNNNSYNLRHHAHSSSFNDSFSLTPVAPPPSSSSFLKAPTQQQQQQQHQHQHQHHSSQATTPSTGGGYNGGSVKGGGGGFPHVLPPTISMGSTPPTAVFGHHHLLPQQHYYNSSSVGAAAAAPRYMNNSVSAMTTPLSVHEPFGAPLGSSAPTTTAVNEGIDAALDLYDVAHIPQASHPYDDEQSSSEDGGEDATTTREMGTTTTPIHRPSLTSPPPPPTPTTTAASPSLVARGLLLVPHSCCSFKWNLYDGVELRCLGAIFSFDVALYFLSIIFIGVMWLALWTALPPELSEPAGAILGPMSTIIVCTFFGQYLFARNFDLPPALGIFLCSIVWNHIFEVGFLTRGTFAALRFVVGKVGLTTILIRAGLALDWKTIKPTVFRTTALATLPFSIEMVVSALLAYTLFEDQYQQDWRWAFLHGFMASVIAAGLIVPEMLGLIARGYNKGVPPLAISAVGFETALGVWAINFMIQLIFSSEDSDPGLLAALGPLQLIGGIVLGIAIAFLFNLLMRLLRRNMWRNPTAMRRFTLGYFLAVSVTVVVFGERFNLAGGGTILALSFSATFAHLIQYDARLEDRQLEAKRAKHAAALQAKIHQERQLYFQQQYVANNNNNSNNREEDGGTCSVVREEGDMTTGTVFARTAPFQEREMMATATTTTSSSSPALVQQDGGGQLVFEPVEIDVSTVPMPPRHHRVAADQRLHLMLDLRDFWGFIVAGPLFSLAGAMVNVPKLVSMAFLPKGLLIMGVGAVVRSVVTASTVSCGMGFGWREILFLPMAWLGKGAVQAATGGVALDAANNHLASLSVNATAAERIQAEKNVEAGQTIVNTAAIYILVSVPLCSLLISRFAPRMLRKPEDIPLNP